MLKVSIDNTGIHLKGSGKELLDGLYNYILALDASGCPLEDLQNVINKSLNKIEKSKLINYKEINVPEEEIEEIDEIKIHKISTKDLSTEKIAEIITNIVKKNN